MQSGVFLACARGGVMDAWDEMEVCWKMDGMRCE